MIEGRNPAEPHAARWQFHVRHLLWLVLGAAVALTLTLQLRLWGAALALLAAACVLLARKRFAAELAMTLLLGLLLLLYAPASRVGSQLERVPGCREQLRQIALALKQYRAEHGRLPPPYTHDAAGRPLHSWRALILPYLPGTGTVSGRYRYDEPWDGPNNRRLHGESCPAFRCPADDQANASATSYLAVVGPGSAWQQAATTGDAADAPDRLLVVEVADSAISWYEPRDLAAESLCPAGQSAQAAGKALASRHKDRGNRGAFVIFASGEVRFVEADVRAELLRRWLGR
jgi:hypothetical protein